MVGAPLEPCVDGREHRWVQVEPAVRQCCVKCGFLGEGEWGPSESRLAAKYERRWQTRTINATWIEKRMRQTRPLSPGQRSYLALLATGAVDGCFYCGIPLNDTNRTLDHKLPKARGGTDHVSNLALACLSCNATKADMTAEEFLALLAA